MICDGSSYSKYIDKGINIFFIFGQEIALKNNARDEIKSYLKQHQGFEEKRIIQESEIDKIHQIILENAGGSLFGSKTLIEISHTKGKIDNYIQSLIEIPNINSMENIAIIIDSRLDKINKRLKWFKAIDEVGLIIDCQKLKSFEEKIWLKKQLNFLDDKKRPEAIERISALNSGNLVAQQNEVNLLKLISASNHDIQIDYVDDNAEFVPFELEDMILKRNPSEALRIIQSIKEHDDHYAALLVWVIGKIINNAVAALQSSRPDAALLKLGVWSNKVSDYKNLMQSFKLKRLIGFQKKIFELDLSNKGINKTNFWERLSDLVLELSSR